MKENQLMMTKHTLRAVAGFCILHSAFSLGLWAQPTAFTYQGHLQENAQPANGLYDLRFELYDADTLGASIGVVTNAATAITNGLFTVTLDFGASVFDGDDRWLEIGAATNGGGAFNTLSPRQPITSAPYAVRALTVSSNALAGYAGAVSFSNPSNIFTGTFSGDGSSLSNINVSTLGGLSASNFWQLGGNAGTAAGVDFFGTTDDQPLELRVNNQRALRIKYATDGIDESATLIGGYAGNSVGYLSAGAVIAGGGASGDINSIGTNSGFSAVGGGAGNNIANSSRDSTIVGGYQNMIGMGSWTSAIGGGENNKIADNSTSATIAGGEDNDIGIDADYSTIAGGRGHLVDGDDATVAGGNGNSALANNTAIGGGSNNSATRGGSTISGGRNNVADGVDSTVGGGTGNDALATTSTVGGGSGNQADAASSTVAGGSGNTASGSSSFIGGGSANFTDSTYSVVSGGQQNIADKSHATVSGGQRSSATGNFSSVVGGRDNTASGGYAFVGGGQDNISAGSHSGVNGGEDNLAQGSNSTVSGGETNRATGNWATVAGGFNNLASGNAATVLGGLENIASGPTSLAMGYGSEAGADYSFAAGVGAKALHIGSVVWADGLLGGFASTDEDQFLIQARGGIGLGSSNTSLGYVEIQQPSNDGSNGLSVVNVSRARTLRAWVDGVDKSHLDSGPGGVGVLVLNEGGGNVGIGTAIPATALDVNGTVTATAFNPPSDRNLKENFTAVDSLSVLERVAALPISQWNFKTDSDIPHIGPMAQDFHAAFGLGTDERHIATVDADGVALAAIQGLNQKLEQKDAKIAKLEQRLAALERIIGHQNQK